MLTLVSSTFLLYDWGFGIIFAKTNHSFTSPWDLSYRSLCIYPHQGFASFHPTSKDSLCGVHGRRNGSMHLHHIYCKIKQQIHGDDKSHKLIKIMIMCGRWKWNTPFMDLPPFYLGNMRTWLYCCIYSFFLGPSCVQIFFNTGTFMCPYFFWGVGVILLGHAIFF